MSAEKGWIVEPPPERERTPPSHAGKWRKMMGAANPKAVDHYHHSPCPVCGYATRYKHCGPIPCACTEKLGYGTKEAQEAHRAYQEEGTWQARQHVAEHERSQ